MDRAVGPHGPYFQARFARANRPERIGRAGRLPARVDALTDPRIFQQRPGLRIVEMARFPVKSPRSGAATMSPIGVTRFWSGMA
jgi:hypothetical protein